MRGGISYVTLMVLNPIIILFYQNCSVLPAERAMAHKAPTHVTSSRVPASIKVEASRTCAEGSISCPKPE